MLLCVCVRSDVGYALLNIRCRNCRASRRMTRVDMSLTIARTRSIRSITIYDDKLGVLGVVSHIETIFGIVNDK